MNIETLLIAQVPTVLALIGLIIRYESRLTRIETKIDILLPKKENN